MTGLHGGSHAIVGVYSGDSRRAGSDNRSDPYDQTVQRATSSTAVSGDAAKLTAIVTSAAGQPGGVVTFSDGDAVIGTATLDSSGHASIAPATLASGTHHIAAAYGGDGDFAPSTGAFDLLVPGAPSSGKEPIGRASLSHRTVLLRSGKIQLGVRCVSTGGAACTGSLALKATSATTRLQDAGAGTAHYSIKANKVMAVHVKPTKDILAMLKRKHGRGVVRVTIVPTGGKKVAKLITVVARP